MGKACRPIPVSVQHTTSVGLRVPGWRVASANRAKGDNVVMAARRLVFVFALDDSGCGGWVAADSPTTVTPSAAPCELFRRLDRNVGPGSSAVRLAVR
jgi:hypothetical protein